MLTYIFQIIFFFSTFIEVHLETMSEMSLVDIMFIPFQRIHFVESGQEHG